MTASDEDYVALGRALAALRRRAGLTQAQAGEVAGVGNTHISSVELGNRGLSYGTMLALLRAYGVGLRELAEMIERGEG
ncbi:MAG TPA: helix-turn-helix transcriptional regulator [Solirubrobacteraceae bacterium]|nr:helix-turn-helix transcriptional regulator [Solirubrobacteraceae bacterium]